MTAPLVAKAPADIDGIARKLSSMGSLARSMPPSWDGAKIRQPVSGPDGSRLGHILPGRGLVLCRDLKTLGITKPVPFVFSPSPIERLREYLGDRRAVQIVAVLAAAKLGGLDVLGAGALMGAITSYNDIINGRASAGKADDFTFQKASVAVTVAANWSTIMRSTGMPAALTYADAAPNRTTVGALSWALTNPAGADKKYLLTFGFTAAQTLNMVMLLDLLAMSAALSATIDTLQTVTAAALTRNTGGAGNLITFPVSTAIGTTASNLTTLYTDQDNNSGASTGAVAMTVSTIVERFVPVAANPPFTPLASGDWGVRSVQSVQLSAAMTAGAFNLNLYRPLHWIPGVGGAFYYERDSTVQIDGLTEILYGSDNQLACLAVYVMTNTTSTGVFQGFMRTVSG